MAIRHIPDRSTIVYTLPVEFGHSESMMAHITNYRRVDVYSLLYKFHRYNAIVRLPKQSSERYIRTIPLENENDDFRHLIPTFICKNYDLLRSGHSVVYTTIS